MKDFFTEQLVKRSITPRITMLRTFYCIFYSILVSYIMLNFVIRAGNDRNIAFFVIGTFVSLLILCIGYRQFTGFNIEYEYSYTNGILDIDIIRNRTRRKNIFSAGVADFEIMAHINDKEHLSQYQEMQTVDFSSGDIKDNTYVFVAVYNGNKKKYIIEPKPELLKAMLTDLTPRRLHIKK